MSAAGFSERFLDSILEGDRRRAFQVVDEARAAGVGFHGVYLDIFQEALREVGRCWEEGRITVADEHMATAITQAAMAHLYDELFAAGVPHQRTLVAACVDTERHEIGLRMLCDLLELEGWNTLFLGAAVPLDSLLEMLRSRKPEALALSAAVAPSLPRLRATIAAVRESLSPAPLVLAGGRPFLRDPELAQRMGADLTARDAVEAVRRLQEHFGP